MKKKLYTVTAEGPDTGKTFLITEMPATKAFKWGYRALGAMARSGLDVPPHIIEMGMAGVVAMGLKAVLGADWADTEPLIDELMACVSRVEEKVPDGRPLVENDIESPLTISLLQSEVLELHTGFSVAAYLLKTWADAGEQVRARDALRNTQTSQK